MLGARRTNKFKTNFKLFIAICFLFIFTGAQELIAQEWVEPYMNTRSLGMGGSLLGLTSDETSLYRNPANLGSIRNYFGVAFDPEIEGQAQFTDIITDKNIGKALDVETLAKAIGSNPDKMYHARFQLTPSFTMRNFGFGLLYRNELNMKTDATSATVNTFYQNDLGAVLAVNESFYGGVLKIGGSIKAFNRIEIIQPELDINGPFDVTSIGAEGSAISYDAAIMIQAPVLWIPTFTAVIHDIGGTDFNKKDGVRARTSEQPVSLKQTVDAAVSIFPIHGSGVRSTWTLEYRDLENTRNDKDPMKPVHFGSEINMNDLFYFRFGINQRYYTAGFELASERVSWQIATYGEEVGTVDEKKEDRRFSTRFLVRF